MDQLEIDFRNAAIKVAERRRQLWLEAKDKRDKAVADASSTKSYMADGYWQAEYRALALYRSAELMAELLSE